MQGKSLRILGTRGVPAAHGGFETFAEHLSLYLAGRGTDPRGSRRFNPDKQAADYDADGAYRRLWGTR